MLKDEYVVVFEHKTVTGSEPNPDFDAEADVSFGNCPNRLVKKVEWIAGIDGPENLAITHQTSHDDKGPACKAATKLAKEHNRKHYVCEGMRVTV